MQRRFSVESLEARRLLHAGSIPAEIDWGTPSRAEGEASQVLVPDFSLVDVNSTSSTSNQAVSPRDYLGTVTGWYFGHAT